jgi:hypothetical protein
MTMRLYRAINKYAVQDDEFPSWQHLATLDDVRKHVKSCTEPAAELVQELELADNKKAIIDALNDTGSGRSPAAFTVVREWMGTTRGGLRPIPEPAEALEQAAASCPAGTRLADWAATRESE